MPNAPAQRIGLTEVDARASDARRTITQIWLASPTHSGPCRQVSESLADIPALTSEITRLCDDLTTIRLLRANLAAAGKASIAADRSGEADPLSYLRDELAAQGYCGPRSS